MAAEFDYLRLQVNRPMMPSVALADSPMGTAAWIAEKFYAWSDNHGDLDKTFSKDLLLTNIMLYLLSENGVEGSFRLYRAIRDELRWTFVPGRIEVPTSVALFRVSTRWVVRLSRRRSVGTTSSATPPCRAADTSLRSSNPIFSSRTCAKASGPLADRHKDWFDHGQQNNDKAFSRRLWLLPGTCCRPAHRRHGMRSTST